MLPDLSPADQTPPDLRELVKFSVRVLGTVIEDSLGRPLYLKIENLRQTMADLRGKTDSETARALRDAFSQLEKLSVRDRRVVARSFTLMLELMNSCENAYRSHRLAQRPLESQPETSPDPHAQKPDALIYVLTAHPTEARASENIAVFHLVQHLLREALKKNQPMEKTEAELRHLLKLTWHTSITREKAPEVGDEAEQIYSILLDPSVLDCLLAASHEIVPVYIRSWVGGDKDGHPGVDEKVLQKSLTLSRASIIDYVTLKLDHVRRMLEQLKIDALKTDFARLPKSLRSMRKLQAGDGLKVKRLKKNFSQLFKKYEKEFGSLHLELLQIRRLLHVFPGLVVPLELRESSEVLMSDPGPRSRLAIDRMLKKVAELSRGGEPRWYARGFIISMASTLEHLRVAETKMRRAFGRARIPIIPLFEQAAALKAAPEIVQAWLRDPVLGNDVRREWSGRCEIMMGYSDSSKESGVLYSRLLIAETMHELDRLCAREEVQAIFFQGSGGSIDRGGGSIQDQTAWWPSSALKTYKVTIQGEMVERSFASPEITRRQIERINQSITQGLHREPRPPKIAPIQNFADEVAKSYREIIHDSEFLELIEKATPYSHLGELRMGSRPVRRTAARFSLSGLRAIPWILCWTQTRVLFPTWWGIGRAWKDSDAAQREALRQAFKSEAVFTSYVRALGFTLAKVELGVWRIYLERSGIEDAIIERFYTEFQAEFAAALEMLHFVTGEKNPLWFRPWLGASIRLRAPMIHPLNLLQIMAIEKKDAELLRLTVTGVSSGMLTTG